MKTMLVAAFCLAVAARPAGAMQGEDWVETRFHRVHLLNGNFIDGQLVKESPAGATLMLKSGQITIRKDLIDRIEIVKMRSIKDEAPPPPRTEVARPPQPAKPAPEKAPADPGPRPDTTGFHPALRGNEQAILDRMKKAPVEQRGDLATELAPLGLHAPPYLPAPAQC